MNSDPIPEGVVCKKCGATPVHASRGRWGPHTERIDCPHCRAVTWGFGPPWRKRAEELLARVAADPAVPSPLRSEADKLLKG